MKIYVITAKNAHLYSCELEEYFRARHAVYVEEKKWVPASPDGLEKDKYDTERAVHFLGYEDNRLIACSRLVPTSEPHLVQDRFRYLCTKPLPESEDVAEWTRGFILPEFRNRSKRIIFEFCYGIIDYARREGIYQVGGIQRTYWFNIWKIMGLKIDIFGRPAEFDDGPWVPAYFGVTKEALAASKRLSKAETSLLVCDGPYQPFKRTNVPTGSIDTSGQNNKIAV